jgi:TonB-linked SusC/RagA family outer membrane protein
MKQKLLFITMLLISVVGYSQQYEIKGKVTDATTGLPLSGVNIALKNSKVGTQTDFDGNFTFTKIPSGSKVVFSYIGYSSFELVVKKDETLTVTLKEDKNALDEVVVVGYTTKKKKDVTGAVSVVSSKTIEDLKPVKIEQALQGTVAGVTASSSSGAPGSEFKVIIRGIASNTNTKPLVLIDGYKGELELLNPADIESLTVLKDAQTSIYGAAGANGVIIVTTKQGKKNTKTKITFDTYTGIQETTKKISLLNATEYAMLLNESYANAGLTLPYPNVTTLGKGTDWQNQVFSKAPITSSNVNISGGSDKITYAAGISSLKQQGIVGLERSGFDRSTARIALGADLSDKIKLGTNFIYTDFNRKGLSEGGLGSVLFNAINVPSTQAVRDTNGDFTLVPSTAGYGLEIINPLAQISNTYNTYNLRKLSGTTFLTYKPFKGLTITPRIGFNNSNSEGKSFSKVVDYGGGKVFNVTRSSVSQNAVRLYDVTYDFFAEYVTSIKDKHNVKVSSGISTYEKRSEGLYATGYDVPYNSWDFADISLTSGTSAQGVKDVGSYKSIFRRRSLFGTLDYDYDKKYFISGILRRDGSSAFGPENSVAYFYSILGGWIISKESFFKENKYLNYLKLRASYGSVGNDNELENFPYRSLLTGEGVYVFNTNLSTGQATGVIPNPKLKWEADQKFDIGVDMNLFNNKIEIVADYFNNKRNDLLITNVSVSGINGASAPGSGFPTVNAGSIRNTGIEFTINYKDKMSDDFSYNLGFNISSIKNEVLSVDNQTGYIEEGSFGVGQKLSPTRMIVGQPIGVFYGYKTDGIFQNQAEVNAHPSQAALGAEAVPGDIRYQDINSDGVIDQKDRTYIGKPNADYTLGFNINLTYKNFDFLTYCYASIGNDLIRNYERTEANLNRLDYVLDRWTGEGTSNSVPRVTAGISANNVFSDYFVEDASYLRIQNVQLGYTIKNSTIEKAGISKIRIYGTANNLFTFSKYKGFDPTFQGGGVISRGIDSGAYPASRTYMLGLNVNF